MLFKECSLIQMPFMIIVTLVRFQIMEHVGLWRVMQVTFVQHNLQDLHVKVIHLRIRPDKDRGDAVLAVVVDSGSLSRDCRVCA